MSRERRYPPSPYPARSEETRVYRDGWDLGWRHLGTLGTARTKEYLDGMTPGPSAHGYRDGARARWVYERKVAQAERQAKAEERAAVRAQWAAEAEGPY